MRWLICCLLFSIESVAADSYALINVNVVDVKAGQVIPNQTVLVTAGFVTRVADAQHVKLTASVTQIDAQDGFLLPGLAEMHAHIPPTRDQQRLEDVLLLYLSQGITTVRGMLGEPGHLQVREHVANGALPGPRILTSGPSLNGGSVRSPEQATRLVRAQHRAGYDHLKIHPGLSKSAFDAIASTARALGMPFVGHVDPRYGLLHAIEKGMTGVDHLDGFVEALLPDDARAAAGFFGINAAVMADRQKIPELAKVVADSGTWIVPTESLIERRVGPRSADQLLAEPAMRFVASSTKQAWAEQRKNIESMSETERRAVDDYLRLRLDLIKAVHDAGGHLLLGSDAPQVFNVPGYAIHEELALYVKAGLSAAEALQTGTINVAQYLGKTDQLGQIKAGYIADFVLLRSNPLDDIANSRRVAGVMAAGRWYNRSDLDDRLDSIAVRKVQ